MLSGTIAAILITSPTIVTPFIGGQAVLSEFVRLSDVDMFVLSLGQVCIGVLVASGDLKRAALYIVSSSIARYTLASMLLVVYSINVVLTGWIISDAILLILALQRSYHDMGWAVGSAAFSLVELSRYSAYTLLSALIGLR